MNILIVEDDAPMALIIAALLRPIAKKIETATTLRDAFTFLVPRHGFEAVLLDLNLPDSLPCDTLEAIRKIKETGTKVIVMTGAAVADLQAVAEARGADACFYKGNSEFVAWLKQRL